MPIEYRNFDVKIEHDPEGYVATVLDSPAGTAVWRFGMPDPALAQLLHASDGPVPTAEATESQRIEGVREFGKTMSSALFGGAVAERLEESLALADSQGWGLRIRLMLSSVPELQDWNWECLYLARSSRFLALSRYTPIVRYVEMPEQSRPIQGKLPLRVLVLLLNADDYTRQVWQETYQALAPLAAQGLVHFDVADPPMIAIVRRMFRREKYHVLHVVSPPPPSVQEGQSFPGTQEHTDSSGFINPDYHAAMLRDERIRLVVAQGDRPRLPAALNLLPQIASGLITQGIPGVLTMPGLQSDAAGQLLHEIYSLLANRYPLEEALAEARKELYSAGQSVAWGIPALYVGTSDSLRFDLEQTDGTRKPQGSTRELAPVAANPTPSDTASRGRTGVAVGKTLQERYEMEQLLGQGGFGAVYRAVDQRLGRTVAIKETFFTESDFVRQFRREAELLADLRHPSLTSVNDYFSEGGNYYLVMEYIPGQDLGEYLALQPQGYLSQSDALRIIAPVVDALVYLHSRNPPIIHRDIKPGNIRLTPDGDVYLVDFGLAKAYDPGQRTTIGARALTPGFAPLEQYGGSVTDSRSDLYALGATIYVMLTSKKPPEAPARMLKDTLVPITSINPTVVPQVEAIINRLLAMRAEDRYPTASALRQDLAPFLTQSAPMPMHEPFRDPNDDYRTQLFRKQGQATIPASVPPPASAAPPADQQARRKSVVPLLIGIGMVLAILAAVGGAAAFGLFGTPQAAVPDATPVASRGDLQSNNISDPDATPTPTVTAGPTDTPTPTTTPTSPATATARALQATATAQAAIEVALGATAEAFAAGQATIAAEGAERASLHAAATLGQASTGLVPDVAALLLENGYTINRTTIRGREVLRANQTSPFNQEAVWARDTDYGLRGYSYVLDDMRVFRNMIELFLEGTTANGVVPEAYFRNGDVPYDGTWDNMPNLIHSVYTYVAKTGDRAFYQQNRDRLQQVGLWIVQLDTNDDGMPDQNPYPFGYYNSVKNSTLHTYAIAHFYGAFVQLAELDRSIGLIDEANAWDERARRLREGFHRPFARDGTGGYWIPGQAWPIAWYNAGEDAIERLETFGVFEALQSGLIAPEDDAAYDNRYSKLLDTLNQQFELLLDSDSNVTPLRLMLRGYERQMLRTDTFVPEWMLDASAPWIVGLAVPAYTKAGYTDTANRLLQRYIVAAQFHSGQMPQFAAGAAARFGPGESSARGTVWDNAAWFLAAYTGHYGLEMTPARLIVRPNPVRTIADDGVQNLSYQGALIQFSLDRDTQTYRLQVNRPTAVELWPMDRADWLTVNAGPRAPGVALVLQPDQEYVVVSGSAEAEETGAE